jgi:hypothetical protein
MDQLQADAQLIGELRQEAAAFRRQWLIWLSLGGAGGAVALLSFAANLPNPDYALRVLWPSLAAFALSLVTAGPALLFSSLRSAALAEHHSAAVSRDQLEKQVRQMPEVLSSPRRMAEKLNKPRNKVLKDRDAYDSRAEVAWERGARWRWAARTLMAVASFSFLLGIGYPLVLVASDRSLVPPPPAEQAAGAGKSGNAVNGVAKSR